MSRREGREKFNPQEQLSVLMDKYKKLIKVHPLEAEEVLDQAATLVKKELLDTSAYPDVPEIQNKSPFKSKEDKADFFDETAQEHESNGNGQLAEIYRNEAIRIRDQIYKEKKDKGLPKGQK